MVGCKDDPVLPYGSPPLLLLFSCKASPPKCIVHRTQVTGLSTLLESGGRTPEAESRYKHKLFCWCLHRFGESHFRKTQVCSIPQIETACR